MAADLPAYLWPAASYGLIESRALSGSSLKQYSSALHEEREWVQSGYRSAHYFTPDNSILSSGGLAAPLPSTTLHNHAIHSDNLLGHIANFRHSRPRCQPCHPRVYA